MSRALIKSGCWRRQGKLSRLTKWLIACHSGYCPVHTKCVFSLNKKPHNISENLYNAMVMLSASSNNHGKNFNKNGTKKNGKKSTCKECDINTYLSFLGSGKRCFYMRIQVCITQANTALFLILWIIRLTNIFLFSPEVLCLNNLELFLKFSLLILGFLVLLSHSILP